MASLIHWSHLGYILSITCDITPVTNLPPFKKSKINGLIDGRTVTLGAYNTTGLAPTNCDVIGTRHVADIRVESSCGKMAKPSTCPLKLTFE